MPCSTQKASRLTRASRYTNQGAGPSGSASLRESASRDSTRKQRVHAAIVTAPGAQRLPHNRGEPANPSCDSTIPRGGDDSVLQRLWAKERPTRFKSAPLSEKQRDMTVMARASSWRRAGHQGRREEGGQRGWRRVDRRVGRQVRLDREGQPDGLVSRIDCQQLAAPIASFNPRKSDLMKLQVHTPGPLKPSPKRARL